MRTLILIFLAAAALSGCAVFSSPKEQPVIEEHADNWFNIPKMNVFSTTAERREVIVKFPDNKFCAEPPPDVAESLVSSLTLLAQGSASDKTTGQVEARLEAAKSLARLRDIQGQIETIKQEEASSSAEDIEKHAAIFA